MPLFMQSPVGKIDRAGGMPSWVSIASMSAGPSTAREGSVVPHKRKGEVVASNVSVDTSEIVKVMIVEPRFRALGEA